MSWIFRSTVRTPHCRRRPLGGAMRASYSHQTRASQSEAATISPRSFFGVWSLVILWVLVLRVWEFGYLSRFRRLVHDPVDGSFQFLELNRFYQMLRETSAQTSFDIAVHAKAADGDATDGRHRPQARH
jgi:hypothetical protein